MSSNEDFFWRKPTEYGTFYHIKFCGYLDMVCCTVSLISNIFIVLVFTRKHMISPINTIFIHMVISESLTLISYLPRLWHEYFRVTLCSISEHRTYTWEMISLYSFLLAFVFRHIGIWMAIMLAVWRYIAIIHPLKERDWCNMETTRRWIFVGYVIVVLFTIPPIWSVAVGPIVQLVDDRGCPTTNPSIGVSNVTVYKFQIPLENYPQLHTIIYAIYGFFIKILPSIVLGAISYKLIVALIEMKENRKEILISSELNNMRKQANRTTKILLVILALFMIGEMPHGIYAMLTAFIGPKFFWRYYYSAMEIFNTLTVFSESFNFIIYYSLSSQFRSTFRTLFTRGRCRCGNELKSNRNYRFKCLNPHC